MDDKAKPAAPPAPRTDYTIPIARTGEQQFACVLRNRSGIDAGSIDMGARFIDELCDGDQQAAVDSAFAIYEKWCRETGKRARRGTTSAGELPPLPLPLDEIHAFMGEHSDDYERAANPAADYYSADDMRSFARAAIAKATQP